LTEVTEPMEPQVEVRRGVLVPYGVLVPIGVNTIRGTALSLM